MSELSHTSRYGDDSAQRAEIRAVGGIHTSLGLILLTLMVYLVSLTDVDEARRMSVYTSLAKAFMFTERSEQVVAVHADGALLSGSRQGLRAVLAYLGDDAAKGSVAWDGPDLIVNLPDSAAEGIVPAELLGRVAAMAGAMEQPVRVEAYAAPGDTRSDPLDGSLGRSVTIARALVAAGGVDERRVAAVGRRTPLPLEGGLGAETMRVRIVIENAEGTL